MFDYKAVGRRIFQAHRRAELESGEKITFGDLAEMCTAAGKRLTAGQISEYEKGEVPPKLEIVAVLAKALAVDPGWLAFGSGSGAPEPLAPVHRGLAAEPVKRVARRRRPG